MAWLKVVQVAAPFQKAYAGDVFPLVLGCENDGTTLRDTTGWVEEHLRRLSNAGIQPHFQLTGIHALETLERMVRAGLYKGPLNLTWIGIGGGFDGPNPFNFFNFVHRAPDGCTLTAESLLKNVLPFNMMAMAMGLHPRCGIEDRMEVAMNPGQTAFARMPLRPSSRAQVFIMPMTPNLLAA